ncbi:MAG: PAS domain S-box protein [Gemmatimonadetes bacterium]|nr:PAS domain S-box protein [Gemmatimonadota bacterium]
MTVPAFTASGPNAAPSRMLEALGAIIAELAGERPLEASIETTLASLRAVLEADEAAIWLPSATSLSRAWSTGGSDTGAADVQAMLSTGVFEAEGIVGARIAGANRGAGALVVRLRRRLVAEERQLVLAVANLLSPKLAHAEKSRRLEVEVEVRTAEIDRERRFTDKIIDSLPVGLYVIDREYRIQAWNRKRETGMQGVSREEALGRTIFEILHRQPGEMLRREFDDVFATGRIHEYQMESMATGELRTYRISKVPMRLGDWAVTHVITIGEDVTDWKEAQSRFAHAEKLAAIGQLAAGVMHEINNPLATIAAIAEGLEFKLADAEKAGAVISPDTKEYLTIIDNEVARCKAIVDGLLDFSRPKQVLRERVDMNEVVERTMLLLKHHVRFKRMHVVRELAPALERVPQASSEQLVQVLMALLLNAMDASGGERGTITIRTKVGPTPGEGVIVEVVDQGHGIARSELNKIFEPFYTTKEAGKGTGLGLSICYAIIQDHRGRIEVDSTPGQGSVFRVILPTVDR